MMRYSQTRRQGYRVSPLLAPLLAVLTISPRAVAQTKTSEAPTPMTFTQTTDTPPDVPVPNTPGAVVPPPEKVAAPATPPGSMPTAVATPISAAPVTTAGAAKPRKCNWEWVRDGYYMRLLNTVGYARFSGDAPSGSAHISGWGTGSILAIGGSFRRGLALAGTLQSAEATATFNGGPYSGATFTSNNEAVKVSQRAAATFSEIGALLDWYPMQIEGLHLGLGVGLGFISVVNQADNSTMYGTSLGGTLLVGYDWPIAPTWALGVALVASGARTPSLKYQGSGSDAGYRLMPYSIGVGVSLLYY